MLPDIFSNEQDRLLRSIFSETKEIVIFSGTVGSAKSTVAREAVIAYSPSAKQALPSNKTRQSEELATLVLTHKADVVFSGELRHPMDLASLLNEVEETEESPSSLGVATVHASTIGEALQHLISIGLELEQFTKVKAIIHCSHNNNKLDVELQVNPFEQFHLPVVSHNDNGDG